MVATYNIENLFDTIKDPKKQDEQFTPTGQYAWTEAKLTQKLKNLGKAIRLMNGGLGPDILALTEVETKAVLLRLRDEQLQELGYQTVVHLEGDDKRGIDNALLSKYPLIGAPKLHRVHLKKIPIWKDQVTRGVLECTLDVEGVPLTVFVCHWPSGIGWKQREAQRIDVGKQLRAIIEDKLAKDPEAEIMVLGDFNANPGEDAFSEKGLNASADPQKVKTKDALLYSTVAAMANKVSGGALGSTPTMTAVEAMLAAQGPKIGTHWDSWSKQWGLIDQIFVSRGLLDNKGLSWVPGSTEVLRDPSLLDEAAHPRQTFPEDLAHAAQTAADMGISDHLPLVARFVRKLV
ncbi:MAG: endonuclease/exonuclease/phosphatase family protein [Myxococcota bacterium]